MSYAGVTKIGFSNLANLITALDKCGFVFIENQKQYKRHEHSRAGGTWQQGGCLHAARLKNAGPGAYEVGIYLDAESGEYKLAWDTYASGAAITAALATPGMHYTEQRDVTKLKNWYGAVTAAEELTSYGWQVDYVENKGEIELNAYNS